MACRPRARCSGTRCWPPPTPGSWARRAWYEGFVAEAIDAFFRTAERVDVTGRRHGGFLRGGDLARWRATVEDSLARDYRERWTVHKPGPWTQGPAFLQQLALLGG